MELGLPRTHYPVPGVPPLADVYRGPGDAALVECLPLSPRQPPAYGDEGAPPQYQEEVASDAKARAKAKARRTTFIRLLTSIFVTVLVALIVAAVVMRIHDSESKDKENDQQETETRSRERITLMSSEATPVPTPVPQEATEVTMTDTYVTRTARGPGQIPPTKSNSAPTARR